MQTANKQIFVTSISDHGSHEKSDWVAMEEPLEIRLEYGSFDNRVVQNVAVTMRTPGNDFELAAGFLFTEGIVKNAADIKNIEHCFIACAENKTNVIQVSLQEGIIPYLANASRNFYTTSSCGVCGKGSIAAIRTVSAFTSIDMELKIPADLLYQFPDILSTHQEVFKSTGGLHASALFNLHGEITFVREDVGRHNALDKLIGAALLEQSLPLNQSILLLSGRASFELVQKAAMAGIQIIAAVGAPSSLAIELADEFGITLAGFLRGNRFNIYTAPQRILIPTHE
ncbi:MAG: formate dehydrogenase accessory sulfurtransferase FdhD, partial [Pedobacter sp.]